MNKYAIAFGKDPEYIPDWCWPDNYEDTDEFNNAFVAGRFETDNFILFYKMFITVVKNPCAMWYWVIDNGNTCISGAIDPGDIEIFKEIYEDKFTKLNEYIDILMDKGVLE